MSETYGWMIRMITQSFKDMTAFMVIWFIGITAFTDAFGSIAYILQLQGAVDAPDTEGLSPFQQYIEPYILQWQDSFLVALGNAPASLGDYSEPDWFIFFLVVLFNVILLLNILISIVADTYAAVSTR